MNVQIRKFGPEDVPAMTAIWNEVVEDGHYEDICPYYRELYNY